jgi:hypothetical protein
MCFFIYAPRNKITIGYFSESIWLRKNGSSTVIADCLIQNDNPFYPINSIKIVYPNLLYKVHATETTWQTAWDKYDFRDFSKTFLNNYNGINDFYSSSNMDLVVEDPKEDHLKWAKRVTIKERNPLTTGYCNFYSGIIDKNKNKLIPEPFRPSQEAFFVDKHVSILAYDFLRHPLDENPRWIRFFFNSKKVVANKDELKHMLIKQATNELKYSYCISGPYDVKKAFVDEILAAKDRLISCEPGGTSYSDGFQHAIMRNYDFLESEGLIETARNIKSETIFSNYYTHIFKGDMSELSIPEVTGNIESPSAHQPPKTPKNGAAHFSAFKQPKDLSFEINLKATYSNIWFKCLSFAGLIAIALGLLKLFI